MDYIDDKLNIFACILLLLAMMVGWGAPVRAAGDPAALFQDANRKYVDLVKDPAKKKVRDNWVRVIDAYLGVAEKYPASDLAPEACLRGAKVYEHFSRYSGKKSDLGEASRIYQNVAEKYPQSAVADDALYQAGLLEERAGNDRKAAALYRRVLDEYARVDMADKAGLKLGEKPGQGKAAEKKVSEKAAEKPRVEEPEQKRPELPARVKKISCLDSEGGARVVVELDGPASYKTWVAPEDRAQGKPVRLVVDIEGARLAPAVQGKKDAGEGIVSSIRASGHPDDRVRVVLDLRGRPSYRTGTEDDPSRIVIDVSGKASPKTAASPRNAASPAYRSTPPRKVPAGTPAQAGRDLPTIATQLCLKVSRIVVDPGHGGRDPGAVSPSGVREKDLTLEIGKLLAKRLKADGFEVFLTRTRDEFVALEERTSFANRKRADLFLSLHINSHQSVSVSGIETYFLNLTTDSSAIEVAARENTFSDKSMSDLQLILNDLMLNSKINESSKFATCVHKNVLSSAANTGYEGKNLGVRQAPFYVLLGAQMPSILIELGFLTSPADMGLLKQRSHQETLVDGIAKGINSYIMNTTYAYSWRNK